MLCCCYTRRIHLQCGFVTHSFLPTHESSGYMKEIYLGVIRSFQPAVPEKGAFPSAPPGSPPSAPAPSAPPAPSATPSAPYEQLMRLSDPSVQLCAVSAEGAVSVPSYPTSLEINTFCGPGGSTFVQLGQWRCPLVPGETPILLTGEKTRQLCFCHFFLLTSFVISFCDEQQMLRRYFRSCNSY